MKKVFVKTNEPDVIAVHRGSPSYEIEFGSEPVEVTEEIAEHLIKNPHFSIVSESDEAEVKELDLDYQKELEEIKGIGKKTAKDIMTVFKTRQSLIEAIERDDVLSFDDDICEKLKTSLGGD